MASPQPEGEMPRKTCLLIEDNKVQAHLIMDMISNFGWNIFTSHDLKSGLETLKTQKIHFILTDLILPDSDGLNTVAIIKQHSPNSIIGAMTAGDVKKDATTILKNSRAQGAEFLLQKPFDIERLHQVLEQAKIRIKGGKSLPLALIIDDSTTIINICEKMLKANGFRTVTAISLDDAFENIDGFDLDVILTDLNMPGMSPFEAIPLIRSSMPGVGIVVMTGEAHNELNSSLQIGADTVITKPFNAEQLSKTLLKAMLIASTNLLSKTDN